MACCTLVPRVGAQTWGGPDTVSLMGSSHLLWLLVRLLYISCRLQLLWGSCPGVLALSGSPLHPADPFRSCRAPLPHHILPLHSSLLAAPSAGELLTYPILCGLPPSRRRVPGDGDLACHMQHFPLTTTQNSD